MRQTEEMRLDMLETACTEYMKAYQQFGGRHHTTKLWKNRIEWIERRLASEVAEVEARPWLVDEKF